MFRKNLVPGLALLAIVFSSAGLFAQEIETMEATGVEAAIRRDHASVVRPLSQSNTLERLESLETEVQRLRVQLAQAEEQSLGQPPFLPVTSPRAPPAGNAFVPPAPADELATQPPYFPLPTQPVLSAEEPVTCPTVRVTGFFQLDTAYFNQDPLNKATVGDIDNGTAFRRTRIAATGNVTEDTSYLLEFDFAQAAPRFADIWLNFDDVPFFGSIRFGRFRQPFGMTELTSVRNLPFLERPIPFALSPFRQTGVMAYDVSQDQQMTYAVSGYRYLTDNFGNAFGDSGGWGTAARITWLPYYQGDDGLIHLGADYSYNDPARDLVPFVTTPEIFIGQNPEFGPSGIDFLPIINIPPFGNTAPIPTGHTNLINLEAAASWGSFLVQSEMRWALVDQLNGARNTFPGFYAHARYVLTGETIDYAEDSGVFDGVVPHDPVRWGKCGGIGAWELTGRVSHLDLNGDLLPGPGRQLTDVTAGLNWYLNRHVKFQFNYIHAFLEDPQLGESEADIYAMRGQLEF